MRSIWGQAQGISGARCKITSSESPIKILNIKIWSDNYNYFLKHPRADQGELGRQDPHLFAVAVGHGVHTPDLTLSGGTRRQSTLVVPMEGMGDFNLHSAGR